MVDAAELLQALRARAGAGSSERSDAIARYLSASDDWRDASRKLGGAFAEPSAAPDDGDNNQGLSGGKDA